MYTVNLADTFVSEAKDSNIQGAMVKKAQSDLEAPLDQLANYVTVCPPLGLPGDWAGMTFINQWLSFYKIDYPCSIT